MKVPAVHPAGEQPTVESAVEGPVTAETFAGRVHLEWEPAASVTTMGQLAFFIEYLKQAGLFDGFVADCPLHYRSPNAPAKRDVLGTVLLSILAGHWLPPARILHPWPDRRFLVKHPRWEPSALIRPARIYAGGAG